MASPEFQNRCGGLGFGDDAPLPAADLRNALETGGIRAAYQPIVRLADRRVIGFEVLARLDHPQHGLLAPVHFIPPMEVAGLAEPLTQQILSRLLEDWQADDLTRLDVMLAINVPLDVLLSRPALAALDEQRVAGGIDAAVVTIELTESHPLHRMEEVAAAAAWLRARGYALSIDDVGPNVRDHRALLELPFTDMKLDKQLVDDAATDSASRGFLLEAISAGRQAGLRVTAEGIENDAAWAAMQNLGVEFGQGFLIGRPMPRAAVAEWHRVWTAG